MSDGFSDLASAEKQRTQNWLDQPKSADPSGVERVRPKLELLMLELLANPPPLLASSVLDHLSTVATHTPKTHPGFEAAFCQLHNDASAQPASPAEPVPELVLLSLKGPYKVSGFLPLL